MDCLVVFVMSLLGFLWVFGRVFFWVFGSGGILLGNGQWWCGGHGGD